MNSRIIDSKISNLAKLFFCQEFKRTHIKNVPVCEITVFLIVQLKAKC